MSYKYPLKGVILTVILFATAFEIKAEISYKEVTSTGMGQSYEEALNNAFAEAISSVNGKNVQTRTIIQVLGGESIPKSNDETNKILNKMFEEILLGEGENKSKTKTKNERKENDKKEEKEKYSQNYIKNLIDETKGGIKSYEVLDKDIDKKGWHKVKVLANVAVFDIPQEAKRTRIAILPFRIYDVDLDEQKLNRILLQELNNYLVQTRKFTVLDRTYVEEITQEKKSILDGKTPAVEMAKIGNELSADFVFIGSIEQFEISEKKTKILSSDKIITKKIVNSNVNFRLLNVATKQINYTNTIKYRSPLKNEDNVIFSISEYLSGKIGEEILYSLYPVLIEKVSNKEIYLGQGGKQFKKDSIYNVYEKGEKIVDSYTNEVIGNIEDFKGKIKITSVTTNYAKAISQDLDESFFKDFSQGKYIVRPDLEDISLSEEQIYKKNKEKIEKKKKERKEKLEDEF